MTHVYFGSLSVLVFAAAMFIVGMHSGAVAVQSDTNQTVEGLHSNLSDAESNMTQGIEENITAAARPLYTYIYSPAIDTGFQVTHAGINVGASHPDIAKPVATISGVGLAVAPVLYVLRLLQLSYRKTRLV